MAEVETVAVIGAGFAGIACARALVACERKPTLFDKGRGPAGRASTRRATLPDGRMVRFDHGLQAFRAEQPAFAAAVAEWVEGGLVAPWRSTTESGLFLPLTASNALPAALLADLDVSWGVRITDIQREGDRWRLIGGDGVDRGAFDAVISAAPAPQSAELLAGPAPRLASAARDAVMAPCWTLMAVWESRPAGLPDAFESTDILFAAFEHAKPDREATPARLVAHATAAWTDANLEIEKEAAAEAMLAPLGAPPALYATAHRWRYAFVAQAAETHGHLTLWDDGLAIGACGDWCAPEAAASPRLGLEAAWRSGLAAAAAITDGLE